MNRADIQWPDAAPGAPLPDGVVRVWAASLAISESERQKLWRSLSPDERTRAERFRFDRHRNRFIAGRGMLRCVLAPSAGATPESLRFSYNSRGKPSLASGFPQTVHFNAAHCEDLLLIAATRIAPVGVDVERVRELKDASDLVQRFFSANESERFHRLEERQRPAAFFSLWTRKEAWLKATGDGIPAGLDRIEVAFEEGDAPRVLSIAGDAAAAQRWTLASLVPANGWIGAVAIEPASPITIETVAFRIQ